MEPLEKRILLDGDGFLTGTDAHLTLSFAADGTEIAGQTNTLAATFDGIAATELWQDAILRAFQTWAVNTNADIGVVTDGGEPFGTAGVSQKDDRFGDIRVGAIRMDPQIGAVSVPIDGVVTGTWFADVLFNTNFPYTSIDDIFGVALHEAGNVFGLEDSNDPASPMNTGIPIPTATQPTATDIGQLQALHGTRADDLNEISEADDNEPADNDSFSTATELELAEATNDEGSAPSIVYGDLTDGTDVDFYTLDTPSNYTGAFTVQVRSAGISLLAPRLEVFDAEEQSLGWVESTAVGGDRLTFQTASLTGHDTIFFKVSGATSGLHAIGGYSLVAIFDDLNQVAQPAIDAVADGSLRFLETDDLQELFDPNEDGLYNDDLHQDDEISLSTGLKTVPGFVEATRYETIASIADSTDVDFYTFKSRAVPADGANVMTVTLRSLDPAGLIPKLEVFDKNQTELPATILSNGGSEVIIQVAGIAADATHTVKVAAANPGQPFDTGNYSLTIVFSDQTSVLDNLAMGTLGAGITQNDHTLYVARPQLFHFVLQADAAVTTTPTVLVATIRDDRGTQVFRLAARPGEMRSAEAVFLEPGTYTVEMVVLTLDGSVAPELSYTVLGKPFSDPFVGDPDDPTNNPFQCTETGQEGFFCYPGGFVSPDPFLWDDFIGSITDPPAGFDLPELITLLLGDWWSWVWTQSGENGPPLAQNDIYHTGTDSGLNIAAGNGSTSGVGLSVTGNVGLLGNDLDPENDAIVALLQTTTLHGELTLATDGGFEYTPEPGFMGLDQFTYKAFDFGQESNLATAKIVVGPSGDFDANGFVSGTDFLRWQLGFGTTTGASLADGNSDLDGDVDGQDLTIWQQQFIPTLTPQTQGDGDADGDVDGRDFLAWQRGHGATTGVSRATGDWDANGIVDGQDLNLWQQSFNSTQTISLSSIVFQESNGQEILLPLNAIQAATNGPSFTASSANQVFTSQDLAILTLAVHGRSGPGDAGHLPATIEIDAAQTTSQQFRYRRTLNRLPAITGHTLAPHGPLRHHDKILSHRAEGPLHDLATVDRALEGLTDYRWRHTFH